LPRWRTPIARSSLNLAAVTDAAANVQLTAWDAHRNANDSITATQVAQENEPAATSLNLCWFRSR